MDMTYVSYLFQASGALNHNIFRTCSGNGVVSEAYNEAFPGCTSDWTKIGNAIDDPETMVVEEPRINVPPSLASEAVLPVTAQSLTQGVTFRYTLPVDISDDAVQILTRRFGCACIQVYAGWLAACGDFTYHAIKWGAASVARTCVGHQYSWLQTRISSICHKRRGA